ncbi:hypothetical protein B0920_02195 [Massilia sp. KIM]|uniref:hypothetical protein n=1 Tax=Massilia sp. KIM TaxID=1955422 RepID=UPI00098EEAF1|nr:hypothetical protein [Massilia sp. KIM]OON62309.1 hypothetical protein B0920_02195 [Massilia sp. KIM]
MTILTGTAQILPLRSGHPAVTDQASGTSKTFTPDFMARLHAVNSAGRWLRARGFPPVAVYLKGRMPSLHVVAEAAPLLIQEACGFNSRPAGAGQRLCSVELHDCQITWFETT